MILDYYGGLIYLAKSQSYLLPKSALKWYIDVQLCHTAKI